MRSSTSSKGVLHTTEAGISRADDGTPGRRIRRGPNNEEFLPQIVPEEAARAPHKFGIPLSWILKVDSTPDRSMTLGNNSWLRQHRNWILAHAEILQLPAANDPRMRDNGDVHNVPGPAGVNWNPADDYGSRCGTSRVDEESSLCDHHNTTVSDCGHDRGMWWTLEALKRDPDEFDMHIFGAFSSYGGLEVLENIVSIMLPSPLFLAMSIVPSTTPDDRLSSTNFPRRVAGRPTASKSGAKWKG